MTSTPGAARRVRWTTQGEARIRLHEPLPTRVDDLPDLPAEYDHVLEAGLRTLGLDDLAPEARAALADHVRLLLAWTEAINLTAIRAPGAVAREHVLDSLAAVATLRNMDARRVLDLGSGGGFPGIPLALVARPERSLLVESVGKKARFLATVTAALGVEERIGVAATRAERLARDPHHRGRWDVVLARAIATLADVAEMALPLLAEGGILVAWKREPLDDELARARAGIDAMGGHIADVIRVPVEGLEDHRLVIVARVRPSPIAYPRDPALRKRHPW